MHCMRSIRTWGPSRGTATISHCFPRSTILCGNRTNSISALTSTASTHPTARSLPRTRRCSELARWPTATFAITRRQQAGRTPSAATCSIISASASRRISSTRPLLVLWIPPCLPYCSRRLLFSSWGTRGSPWGGQRNGSGNWRTRWTMFGVSITSNLAWKEI